MSRKTPMRKQKKTPPPSRKSTIGYNPLDQLEQIPTKGRKKTKFKDASAQDDIKDVLLKKPKQKSGPISKWFKSVLGRFS